MSRPKLKSKELLDYAEAVLITDQLDREKLIGCEDCGHTACTCCIRNGQRYPEHDFDEDGRCTRCDAETTEAL
jgi:hypothetical protein